MKTRVSKERERERVYYRTIQRLSMSWIFGSLFVVLLVVEQEENNEFGGR
jgi:hypothetical protein